MTANEKFFQEKRAAAVLKHGILDRYLPVFTSKTGSSATGGQVVYLDGFAGPGRYEPEDGQSVGAEGSPLLAMRTATAVQTFGRTLHCVFVERAPHHYENLCLTLEREVAGKNYEVLPGDVSGHLDRVLAVADDRPLLAFLDPFGTGLPYAEMTDRLLRRPTRPPTEVLLNFNLQSVWRIGGLLAGDETGTWNHGLDAVLDADWLPVRDKLAASTTNSPQSATASLARIDDFLGNEWWRDVFRNSRAKARHRGERTASARAAQVVAQEYCRRIEADTGYRSFSVPIRRQPGQEPFFMLILFYRYRGTPYAFNGAVSKANEAWRKFISERSPQPQAHLAEQEDLFGGTLTTGMTDEQNTRAEARRNQEWISMIARNVTTLLAVHGPVDVQDRTKDIFGTTLGLARETHLRAAWDLLANQGVALPRLKGKNKIENQTIRPA
ncbi:three-Cys-motif partner protein TcmP [Saccharothrix hoggarensis]|uniref:Three-Cys-motif partner protein TcmP n=1 Tax=Saccharothrix hoggarensis TaxID=913853 RepID=A0ABW3QW84_9PSEU